MKNLRDFAYQNMKKGLLFRSEALTNLSQEDRELLINKGIKYIIDLRMPEEIAKAKDVVLPNVKSINFSLLIKDKDEAKEMGTVIVKGLELPDYSIAYRQIVRPNRKEIWSQIFDTLISNEGAFLFHCSQGKDRTGVAVMIILSALGIDKETIYQDYLLTNNGLVFSPDFEQFAASLPDEVRIAFIEHFSARAIYLDASYDEINKIYGSMDEFLKQCCSLDADKLSKLRNKYLL